MFGALAALFLSVGIFAATNLQEKERVSDLTLANIEAMTGGDGDISEVLNGPQKGYSCPDWFAGRGFRCAAEINTKCSEIPCR